MLRIVVNVLLLVGISLGGNAQEKGGAYELKLDSVSVLGITTENLVSSFLPLLAFLEYVPLSSMTNDLGTNSTSFTFSF